MRCFAASLLAALVCGASPKTHVRYLIVGAGPGGLQLAHFLESAGRDYLIIESAAAPASFFSAYPRWRQLISINKRHVGRNDSLAFSQRHDWNSLLSEHSHSHPAAVASSTDARLNEASVSPSLRFTSWHEAYYPPADTLVQYMSAWAAAPGGVGVDGSDDAAVHGLGRSRPLRVRYKTRIMRVSRFIPSAHDHNNSGSSARFILTTDSGDTYSCTFLIVATGLQELIPMPSANGSAAVAAGLLHTYATAPTELEAYRGKRVLLLGHGNAAWEFAHHILGVTAYVHVAGRDTSRLKLALESHYPGHVRAVHGTLLESYNLKSLDGITSAAFHRLTFAPAATEGGRGGVAVALHPPTCTFDAFGRATSRCSFRAPYDIVVACLGWRFDRKMFDEDVCPALSVNGKHPATTPRYESSNVRGMFFVGTLAHAADYKIAAGGFIHGFRYTARALHRFLEEEEAVNAAAHAMAGVSTGGAVVEEAAAPTLQGHPPAAWPSTHVRTLRALVALVLRRLNSAAGLYQMFSSVGLTDVFVFGAIDADAVAGFVSGGAHAAMQLPWEFFDASAAAAALSGSDASGLAADVAASQQARAPAGTPPRSAAARASEVAVDAALEGRLYEEVPAAHATAGAHAWSKRGRVVEWLTLSLEFGPSPPPGSKDPFALDRADVSLSHPERSHFLHPVIRYFHSGAPGCGWGGVNNSGSSRNSSVCAPIATCALIEDFHAEWRLHTAHVLPLARFVQHIGARRAAAALGGQVMPVPWLPPAPPPPFLAGILSQLLSGCDASTLYWGGATFDSSGETDGWWLKLSIAAEASLAQLRALAVHATDPTPGVALSSAEEAHTQSVRDKWAAFRAREGGGEESDAAEELPRPHLPDMNKEQVAAAAAARADFQASYSALTSRSQGLGVLVVHARSGRCRVLAENLRVALGAVRVFFGEDGKDGGSDGTKGGAVDVEARPLTATAAVPHLRAIVARRKG